MWDNDATHPDVCIGCAMLPLARVLDALGDGARDADADGSVGCDHEIAQFAAARDPEAADGRGVDFTVGVTLKGQCMGHISGRANVLWPDDAKFSLAKRKKRSETGEACSLS